MTDDSLATIIETLRRIRLIKRGMVEVELHDEISAALSAANIQHEREHRAGRCRFDFFLPETATVIEVKKGYPDRQSVRAQLERYLARPEVAALVLVMDRSFAVPNAIGGKPVHVVSLAENWGIA